MVAGPAEAGLHESVCAPRGVGHSERRRTAGATLHLELRVGRNREELFKAFSEDELVEQVGGL